MKYESTQITQYACKVPVHLLKLDTLYGRRGGRGGDVEEEERQLLALFLYVAKEVLFSDLSVNKRNGKQDKGRANQNIDD